MGRVTWVKYVVSAWGCVVSAWGCTSRLGSPPSQTRELKAGLPWRGECLEPVRKLEGWWRILVGFFSFSPIHRQDPTKTAVKFPRFLVYWS